MPHFLSQVKIQKEKGKIIFCFFMSMKLGYNNHGYTVFLVPNDNFNNMNHDYYVQ